jgi:hypothetical protein
MPTEQVEELKKLLKENVHNITTEGGSDSIPDLPDYEIHPREFFGYAEEEMDDLKTNRSIVNCISNLKRAMDSQVDILLYSLNLQKLYKDKRLGFDRKIGFINKCGFFNKGSLSRINAIRNKLEHHYEIPLIEDIEVYFDLVYAFIIVLEGAVSTVGRGVERVFDVIEWKGEDIDHDKIGKLSSSYDPKKVELRIHFSKRDFNKEFVANSENLDELAFFIKVHSILSGINDTYHSEYSNSQILKL